MSQNGRLELVARKYAALIAGQQKLRFRLDPDDSEEDARFYFFWTFEITGSGFFGRIREAVGETGYEPMAMLEADLTMLEIFSDWLNMMSEEQLVKAERALDDLTREFEEALKTLPVG